MRSTNRREVYSAYTSEHHIRAQQPNELNCCASPKNTASSSLVSRVVLSGLTRVLYTFFILIAHSSFHRPHFHGCRALYHAGRSHEIRMCGTIATEILFTGCELNLFDIPEDYRGKTRFSETRNSPNSSITTPTGSNQILLNLTMSTSGASLLHHCQRGERSKNRLDSDSSLK